MALADIKAFSHSYSQITAASNWPCLFCTIVVLFSITFASKRIEMLFYCSITIINILVIKIGLDILQLLQNRVIIQKINAISFFAVKNRLDILQLVQKSTRYFATFTKNWPDILLSKYQPDIFKVAQKSNRYFAAKNWVGFLVENRPTKSMHNFETNGAPYVHGY